MTWIWEAAAGCLKIRCCGIQHWTTQHLSSFLIWTLECRGQGKWEPGWPLAECGLWAIALKMVFSHMYTEHVERRSLRRHPLSLHQKRLQQHSTPIYTRLICIPYSLTHTCLPTFLVTCSCRLSLMHTHACPYTHNHTHMYTLTLFQMCMLTHTHILTFIHAQTLIHAFIYLHIFWHT